MRRSLKLFRSPAGPRSAALALVATAALALAGLTGIAIAKSFTLRVAKHVKVTSLATHASKSESILVDSMGMAVYTLSGETAHHLKCTSTMCLMFWPPVTVGSAHAKLTKGPGVKGKLAVIHRGGFFQVTLNGHPLYMFKLDGGKTGVAMGDGVASFGGTWHVIKDPSGGGGGGPMSGMPSTMPTTTTTY